MRIRLVPALTLLAAIYSEAAVATFLFHFSPSAASPDAAVVLSSTIAVVLPYAALLAASRIARDALSVRATAVASVLTALIGAVAYAGAFGYNDGEYAFMFYVAPIVQAPFAMGSVFFALSRREAHQAQKNVA